MISFDYEGNKYTVGFNRTTAGETEQRGFRVMEIGDLPASSIITLYRCSFLANHRTLSVDFIDKVYDSLSDKSGFIRALYEEYVKTLETLTAEEGNTNWVRVE